MKSLIVRLSVFALAATGFAASTVATKSSKDYEIKTVVVGTVGPAAMCPPGTGNNCGIR